MTAQCGLRTWMGLKKWSGVAEFRANTGALKLLLCVLHFATACWRGHNSAHRWKTSDTWGPGSWAATDKGLLGFPVYLIQLWTLINSSFAHSLTQIAPLLYPSVFNSAWSEHAICFCLIPIIFTTRVCWTESKRSYTPRGCLPYLLDIPEG